jgi:hypothetical protein
MNASQIAGIRYKVASSFRLRRPSITPHSNG